MPCKKINNNSDLDLGRYKHYLDSFIPYTKKVLGYNRPFVLNFQSDQENSKKALGRTAFYDPNTDEVTIYVDGRHIKDIMRSIAHELVHHTQNCRGEFEGGCAADDGYAQTDSHLRGMEREAYEKGNMLFRDWEDGYKRVYGENIMKTKIKVLREEIEKQKLDELNVQQLQIIADIAKRINTATAVESETLERYSGKVLNGIGVLSSGDIKKFIKSYKQNKNEIPDQNLEQIESAVKKICDIKYFVGDDNSPINNIYSLKCNNGSVKKITSGGAGDRILRRISTAVATGGGWLLGKIRKSLDPTAITSQDDIYRNFVMYMNIASGRENKKLEKLKSKVGSEAKQEIEALQQALYGTSGSKQLTGSGRKGSSKKRRASCKKVLRKGCPKKDVEALQKKLKQLGYDLGSFGPNKDGIDGDYGGKTVQAVKQFQEKANLKVDGAAGPNTQKALAKALKGPLPAPQKSANKGIAYTGSQVRQIVQNNLPEGDKGKENIILNIIEKELRGKDSKLRMNGKMSIVKIATRVRRLANSSLKDLKLALDTLSESTINEVLAENKKKVLGKKFDDLVKAIKEGK